MQGRNPMKGRHNVGGRTGNPGTIRGGQPEPASNKFKTASSTRMGTAAPVRTKSGTSQEAERQVKQPPQPFANRRGAAQMPVPTHPLFRAGDGARFAKSTVDRFSTESIKNVHVSNAAAIGGGIPTTRAPLDVRNSLRARRVVGGGNQPRAKR